MRPEPWDPTVSLFGALFYLVPTIFAWIVRRAVPEMPVVRILVVNVLLGWTVVGWIGCFGYVVYRLARVPGMRGRMAPGDWQPSRAPELDPPRARAPCSSCNNGRARCTLCGGQRGQHVNNVWVPCSYCGGSGEIQCMQCGGSGRAPF